MELEITFEPILMRLEKRELRAQIFRERVLVGLDDCVSIREAGGVFQPQYARLP